MNIRRMTFFDILKVFDIQLEGRQDGGGKGREKKNKRKKKRLAKSGISSSIYIVLSQK